MGEHTQAERGLRAQPNRGGLFRSMESRGSPDPALRPRSCSLRLHGLHFGPARSWVQLHCQQALKTIKETRSQGLQRRSPLNDQNRDEQSQNNILDPTKGRADSREKMPSSGRTGYLGPSQLLGINIKSLNFLPKSIFT